MILNNIELSSQQKEIIDSTGNIVVSASAGTGKTRTMTAKVISDLSQNKTHKVIAAITFTIRAAKEIRDRLTLDSSQCFVGTNNSFAIEEIIKPFMKDAYGNDFDIDMDTDYTNRERKLNDLVAGVESIKEHHTIYSYHNNRKNFVFDLALEIIKNSAACRHYLKAKYFSLYIDEYQDCDTDMHNFFMYISNVLKIKTFIVGDDKQAIYRWRGANPELFKSVFTKENYTHKELLQNHRSEKQIQDYSNLFFDRTRQFVENPQNCEKILWLKATNDDWAERVVSLLDSSHTSALLRYAKTNTTNGKQGASEGADMLTRSGFEHIYIPPTPIDDITTNSAWLYTAVASYVLLENYSAYDFINDIPSESDAYKVGNIQRLLSIIKQHSEEADLESVAQSVRTLADYLGYVITEQHIVKLYETVTDVKYAIALNPEKPLHCALTLHSSKGLEFDQVILFLEDYAHNGNVTEEHINNHYVACTRAKSKLIIIANGTQDAKAAGKRIASMFKAANLEAKQLISVQQ